MKNKLYVHADLGNGEIVLAGQLIVDRQARRGAFKYARDYCADPRAYALDPINLPLKTGAVYESPITREHMGIAGALMDAGPDDWGKKVLIALLDPPPTNDLEFLLAGSGNGVGSIYFSARRDDHPMQALPREFANLEEVMETALAIDEGLEVEKEKAMFFQYGSSIGGTRPKTFIDEATRDEETGQRRHKRWIVKFSRKGEIVNQCVLEHATMKMARDAGINVPETRVMETALGPVFLIERFDVDGQTGESSHLVSARSLINKFDTSELAPGEISYANIGRIARQISESGVDDNKEVFRRMLFNIAVGNVDDHLKNTSFIKPAGQKKMKLAPVYDVLPTVGMQESPQFIAVGPQGGRQNPENLAGCAEEMGIEAGEAAAIAEDVLEATEDWAERYAEEGLTPKELAIVSNCLKARQFVQKYLQSIPQAEREREAKHSMSVSL